VKQNRKNQRQKKRSAKGSPNNPFALRITCLARNNGPAINNAQYNTFFATGWSIFPLSTMTTPVSTNFGGAFFSITPITV
jgi:hypothetical protein